MPLFILMGAPVSMPASPDLYRALYKWIDTSGAAWPATSGLRGFAAVMAPVCHRGDMGTEASEMKKYGYSTLLATGPSRRRHHRNQIAQRQLSCTASHEQSIAALPGRIHPGIWKPV